MHKERKQWGNCKIRFESQIRWFFHWFKFLAKWHIPLAIGTLQEIRIQRKKRGFGSEWSFAIPSNINPRGKRGTTYWLRLHHINPLSSPMVLPWASRSERGCFDPALPRCVICHPFTSRVNNYRHQVQPLEVWIWWFRASSATSKKRAAFFSYSSNRWLI